MEEAVALIVIGILAIVFVVVAHWPVKYNRNVSDDEAKDE